MSIHRKFPKKPIRYFKFIKALKMNKAMKKNIIRILGVNFFKGHVKEVVNTLKSGGLLVVPSGHGLAEHKPAIICTGAAIAFLTGRQAQIPNWADRFFLGWLFRCMDQPKLFIPRYLYALKLILVMIQFNGQSQITKTIE